MTSAFDTEEFRHNFIGYGYASAIYEPTGPLPN
jgi:hypothetical protein